MCFWGAEGGKEGEAAGLTACILVPEVLVAALSSGEAAVWGTSGAPENLEWGQPRRSHVSPPFPRAPQQACQGHKCTSHESLAQEVSTAQAREI